MKDQQVLDLDTEPVFGLEITFPEDYTEADMEAIWEAVHAVQKARNLT